MEIESKVISEGRKLKIEASISRRAPRRSGGGLSVLREQWTMSRKSMSSTVLRCSRAAMTISSWTTRLFSRGRRETELPMNGKRSSFWYCSTCHLKSLGRGLRSSKFVSIRAATCCNSLSHSFFFPPSFQLMVICLKV